MLSAQDKQAILNGAYGITVEGKKVKYIGKRDLAEGEPASPYFFVILSENGNISRSTYLSEDLTHALGDGNIHEVVGLWDDRLDPFNLERALNGEPVKLRRGYKAYIKYVMPPEYRGKYPFMGYIMNPDIACDVEPSSWTLEGKSLIDVSEHENDIIGMWKEKEIVPFSANVTVTLPRALKEPQDKMWFVDSDGPTRSSYGKNIQLSDFEKIPYFGSEEDANAWFQAMKDSRP